MDKKKCSQCGYENNSTANFCKQCGTKLTDEMNTNYAEKTAEEKVEEAKEKFKDSAKSVKKQFKSILDILYVLIKPIIIRLKPFINIKTITPIVVIIILFIVWQEYTDYQEFKNNQKVKEEKLIQKKKEEAERIAREKKEKAERIAREEKEKARLKKEQEKRLAKEEELKNNWLAKYDAKDIFADYEQKLIWQDNYTANNYPSKQWVTNDNFKYRNYFDTSGDTASSYCKNLILAGYSNWRLPTVSELKNLYPQKDKLNYYVSTSHWTSQTRSLRDSKALIYDFDGKERGISSDKFYTNVVRCVAEPKTIKERNEALYNSNKDVEEKPKKESTNDRSDIIATLAIPNGKVSIKRAIDETMNIKNGDGRKFYSSDLYIIIEIQNKNEILKLDSDLYIHKDLSWNGMEPAILYDNKHHILTIFTSEKNPKSNYGMNGYSYRYDLNSKKLIKDKLFYNDNWGWFSFFEGSNNGQPILWHFSYNGYYAIKSTRLTNGKWSNIQTEKIYPKQVKAIYKDRKKKLITSTIGNQTMSTK